MNTNNDGLATTATSALDKLNKALAKSGLDDLVKARTQRALLLVDCSGSMADTIRHGEERKIDALRKVVSTLRETRAFPMAAFGVRCAGQVEVVDTVPEPQGGTPLDLAIEFATAQGANKLVVVTDGEPNDERMALRAASAFGGPIDVFYIGDGNDRGYRFCVELAKQTGGTCGLTDLNGDKKALAGKIQLALGDGSEAI